MKKNKKEVFRRDDNIRIVNPEFFVRVGYPFDKKYAVENLISDKEKGILQGLLGDPEKDEILFSSQWVKNEKVYFEMLDRLAYHKLNTVGFGGHERKIFTKSIPKLAGKQCRVMGKRVVKTGVRNYDSEYNEWGGQSHGWYFLSNEKSHVILEVNLLSDGDEEFISSEPYLWIEEKNVEKVKNE